MSASNPIKRARTDGDVRQLKLLINNRFSRDAIAQLLGRTPSSIQQKTFWLKLSIAPRPEQASNSASIRIRDRS
jgi:hypothetical protein